MKPPFSYYGGKQRIASKIIPFIPKHTVYCEPFCGGATLLFRKPFPEVANNNYNEYINDTNSLVFNFFNVLSTNGKELSDRLSGFPMCEQHHGESKEVCKNPDRHNNMEKAVAFFVNIQQSFGNALYCGWRRSVYGASEQTKWSNHKNLYPYIERMSSVGVSNEDALSFIEHFDSPQTFFYCDPPYPNTDQGHYNGYTQKDFDDLIELLDSCQGSAIVSCYKQDNIPDSWETRTIESTMSVSGNTGKDRSKEVVKKTGHKRVEYLYIKKSVEPRSEILKLYKTGKYNCFTGDSVMGQGKLF